MHASGLVVLVVIRCRFVCVVDGLVLVELSHLQFVVVSDAGPEQRALRT